jgi:hypothetical protein
LSPERAVSVAKSIANSSVMKRDLLDSPPSPFNYNDVYDNKSESDDADILYNPTKMLINYKRKFHMTFHDRPQEEIERQRI